MSRRGSLLVAIGILASRAFGLVRQRVLAHYLGQGDAADALATAFRIPNFLQNLLGEGALSASFIPRYSKLLADGDEFHARRLAGALLSVMVVTLAALVLLGELATPWLMTLLVSTKGGWSPEKRALTQSLVRILFPGTGLMVLSAWCLGVLNSHRRFLLSYAAPVVWNVAIIGAVILFARHETPERFVVITAWGAVAGAFLQVAVQWPSVMAVGGHIVPLFWNRVPELLGVVRAFIPNVMSRGANQISALVDLKIATSIGITGAVTAMTNAQVLYLLPVSLFGMAVSAAELPEMAAERGDAQTVATALRLRLGGATQRLGFYIIPSAIGFLTLGGVIAGAVFRSARGVFTAADADFVWIVLAGSAFGLLASTLGRLYSSTFYALNDTRTPLYCGIIRVVLTGGLGWLAGIKLPPLLHVDLKWGVAGLTATAGIAGWVEFALLRRSLCRRIGRFSLDGGELLKLWIAALVAAAVSTAIRLAVPADLAPISLALLVVPINGIIYLALTSWWNIPEAAVLTGRIRRVLRGEFRLA